MDRLLQQLKESVLCGDGAMGTLLAERGIPSGSCFEELCLSQPGKISEIHREYLSAGAALLTTNSFGANTVKLASFGLQSRVAEINCAAARHVRQAVDAS